MAAQTADKSHFTTWDVLKPVGVSAELFLPNEPITPLNCPQVLRLIVSATIGGIPSVETLLNSFAMALWPDRSSPELIWTGFHARFKELIRHMVDEEVPEHLLAEAETLRHSIKQFLAEKDEGLRSQLFEAILASVTTLQSTFPDENEGTEETPDDWHDALENLKITPEKNPDEDEETSDEDFRCPERLTPFLIPLGTFHLALLWSQWKFPEQIHGTKDSSPDNYRQDLESTLEKYADLIARARTECLKWRREQIEEPEMGSWNWSYFVGDEVTIVDRFTGESEYFQWGPGYRYQDDMKWEAMLFNLNYAVDNKYTAELDAVLGPALIWDLFKPGSEAEGVKDQCFVYPGWIGNGKHMSMDWFDHRELYEKHGSITKIILHADDTLYGMEVFYGDQSAGLRGAKKGSEHVLHLGSQESITKLEGAVTVEEKKVIPANMQAENADGEPNDERLTVDRLEFTKCTQILDESGRIKGFKSPETVGGGRADINYSHDGNEKNNRYWNRLLWLSGWSSNRDDGGHIQMIWPVFGYRQDFFKDGTCRRS